MAVWSPQQGLSATHVGEIVNNGYTYMYKHTETDDWTHETIRMDTEQICDD